ncbi:DUF4041 domain-containing protein [Methanobrevibacter sp.]|uniref:DUF4041 domain-containing protein n=1 Tax=Methanobrevibacter sp. TaxID=66852 RepID=UPI0025D57120|nr:DUF4041 domain-containing protein [Methanobrevibacter sp.]MBQ2832422.1 DUF4041 domain-containing protein [Methanobrevibacter sp.]
MDKGLILIIVGGAISLTLVGAIIGVPLIFIGVYLTNKTLNNMEQGIDINIAQKQYALNNIEKTLAEKEKEAKEKLDNELKQKEENLNKELKEKQDELDHINEKLDQLEKEKIAEVDEKLAKRDTDLDKLISEKETQLNNLDSEYESKLKAKQDYLNKEIEKTEKELLKTKKELKEVKNDLVRAEDDLEMQEYGLYEPRYNFIHAVDYKERLDAVRKQQKQMIKDKTAAIASKTWTINGSEAKGRALTNANIKQILRSFNNETTVLISKVKHSNIDSIENRINKTFTSLNKLYERENVELTKGYLNLKIDELHIAYEYEVKKEEEKEELREAREREREEKKLQKELEREKKKFERENETINSEIEEVKAQLAQAAADEKAKLEAEIAKLQAALDKNNEEVKKINEWKEKPGAGYVYIISNIGSFGEDVFKIGVTRRDNPEDRIRELSSASVPFRFDTHVFIFSKNAYDLESELHERFDDKRVNKVNMRKEFFRISIDDVKQIVEENKGQVHSFVEHPDAEEYYDTLKKEKLMGV